MNDDNNVDNFEVFADDLLLESSFLLLALIVEACFVPNWGKTINIATDALSHEELIRY
jgi:hypothetical protein